MIFLVTQGFRISGQEFVAWGRQLDDDSIEWFDMQPGRLYPREELAARRPRTAALSLLRRQPYDRRTTHPVTTGQNDKKGEIR